MNYWVFCVHISKRNKKLILHFKKKKKKELNYMSFYKREKEKNFRYDRFKILFQFVWQSISSSKILISFEKEKIVIIIFLFFISVFIL